MKYTKPISVFLGFVFAAALTTLAAIGAVALAVDDAKLRPTSSSDVASWIQAVAAALAILASAGLALHIQSRESRERRSGAADIAADIALVAKTILTSISHEFSSRQRVYEFAESIRPFDREALDDLWNMISQLDLQALHEPFLIRPIILLRTSVRKVRQTITTALAEHRNMDGHDFDELFDILKREAAVAELAHSKICAAARRI